jgi:uncharacterized SAM-dependent methyltransferase
LYLTDRQGILYEKAISSESYNKNVQLPLSRVKELIPLLWRGIHVGKTRPITLIDLGPAALEEATQHINLFKSNCDLSKYIVVDINEMLLERVADRLSIKYPGIISEICEQFENVTRDSIGIIPNSTAIFLIGSTAMNYQIPNLAKIMNKMAAPGDFFAITIILHNRRHLTSELTHDYESAHIDDFTFAPLKLIGGEKKDYKYIAFWNNDRVEFRFRAIRNSTLAHPKLKIIKPGDTFITGFSRRPSISKHLSDLELLFDVHRTIINEERIVTSLGRIRMGGSKKWAPDLTQKLF